MTREMEGYQSLLVTLFAFRLPLLVSCLAHSLPLMIDVKCSSETSGSHQTTRHYNPEDPILHIHRRDNLQFINQVERYGTGKDVGISDVIVP